MAIFYATLHGLTRFLFWILFRLKTDGADRIPSKGPALIAANHTSYLDPLAVACAARRPVRFIVMKPVYDVRWLTWFLKSIGCIRVNGAIQQALETLRGGEVLGVFPEGGRSRDGKVGKGESGAVRLALEARCPLIPAAVIGSYDAWPPQASLPKPFPMRVVFGKPITPDELWKGPAAPNDNDLDLLTERVMQTIRSLLENEGQS